MTGLLEKNKPAIEQTTYTGDRKESNYDFVDAVARKNVELTIKNIRQTSQVLRQLEQEKKIKIVGSMYHLSGGKVEFFDE